LKTEWKRTSSTSLAYLQVKDLVRNFGAESGDGGELAEEGALGHRDLG